MRLTLCASIMWLGWWTLHARSQPVFVSPTSPPANSSQLDASLQINLRNSLAIRNGSSSQPDTTRFVIPGTTRALDFRRIGRDLPRSLVDSLLGKAQRDVAQKLRHHSQWERVPGGQWDIVHRNLIFFVKENSQLPRSYPRVTWGVVEDLIPGLDAFFRQEEDGRARHVEFDVLTEFNAHGLVDFAFGGLAYLEPPPSSSRRP